MLKLRGKGLVSPTRRLKFWVATLNSRPEGKEGDNVDLRRASLGAARGAISKQKTFDNTVRIADEASGIAGRSLIWSMMAEWKQRSPPDQPIFNISHRGPREGRRR